MHWARQACTIARGAERHAVSRKGWRGCQQACRWEWECVVSVSMQINACWSVCCCHAVLLLACGHKSSSSELLDAPGQRGLRGGYSCKASDRASALLQHGARLKVHCHVICCFGWSGEGGEAEEQPLGRKRLFTNVSSILMCQWALWARHFPLPLDGLTTNHRWVKSVC